MNPRTAKKPRKQPEPPKNDILINFRWPAIEEDGIRNRHDQKISCCIASNSLHKPMHIEKNVAKIERDADDYRIVVTVEKRRAEKITQEKVEILLTQQMQYLFKQRVRSVG